LLGEAEGKQLGRWAVNGNTLGVGAVSLTHRHVKTVGRIALTGAKDASALSMLDAATE
jgi:hypothetical protein